MVKMACINADDDDDGDDNWTSTLYTARDKT